MNSMELHGDSSMNSMELHGGAVPWSSMEAQLHELHGAPWRCSSMKCVELHGGVAPWNASNSVEITFFRKWSSASLSLSLTHSYSMVFNIYAFLSSLSFPLLFSLLSLSVSFLPPLSVCIPSFSAFSFSNLCLFLWFLWFVHISLSLSLSYFHQSIYLFNYLSIYPSIYLSIYLSIHLSISLSSLALFLLTPISLPLSFTTFPSHIVFFFSPLINSLPSLSASISLLLGSSIKYVRTEGGGGSRPMRTHCVHGGGGRG